MLIAEKKKYTAADYMMLEEGAPFQLIENDLVMSPSPVPAHQIISGRLFLEISLYLKRVSNKGTLLFAPMDVHFDDDNIFQPDLLFISEAKSNIIKNSIQGAPDLVIEILSPSTGYYDIKQKKDIYQKYGVAEYIIVDPMAQDVDLYILKDSVYVLDQHVQQTGMLNSVLFSGLSIDVKRLFD